MRTELSATLTAPREGRFLLAQALCGTMAALLVLSWLTTEHFLPWVSWHAEVLSFFAVFLGALTVIVGKLKSQKPHPIRVPVSAAPFALIGAVAIVQVFTGLITFSGDALVVCFYFALCITCLIAGFNTEVAPQVDGRSFIQAGWPSTNWLAFALVFGSLASVLVASAQVFDLWEHSGWIVRMPDLRRPGGNLGQPNQLATLLVMGVAGVTFLHVSGKLNGWICGMILLVLGAGLALSESRTGVLGLMVLLLWWQLKRRAVASHVSAWAGPVVGVGFLTLYFFWPHLLNSMQISNGNAEHRFTNGDLRLAMWSQLLEAVWLRPMLGWGIMEVAEAHNSVAHGHTINNPFSYSHNLVIDLGVWMGLPIAFLLTAAASVWLWRRSKAVSHLTPWFCLAVAVPLVTHSMLEFPFAYAYFLAPTLYLLGVLEASVGARPLLQIGSRTAFLALLSIGAVLAWSLVEYLAVEEDFRIVRFEQLRIGKTPEGQHRPNVVLLTQLGALLSGSRVALEPSMSASSLQQLKNLALRYPWIATQYRYAVALALNGEQQEATRQFQIIRWQRGEKVYATLKREVDELAKERYPMLRALRLP